MAEDESILASPPTQDMAHHVRDYSRFVKMFKWGAIISAIAGLFVMMIIS